MEKTILIVDDSYTTRWLLEKLIKKLSPGSICLTAKNGLDAMEKIQEREIDLIITSIHMSKMNGLTLLKKISLSQHKGPMPEIILMHEFNHDRIGEALPEIEILGFLEKPPNKSELKRLLEKGGILE